MAAEDTAKKAAGGLWGLAKGTLRQTVPVFNSAANRNWMLGLTAATALTFLAPPVAFAAAANALPAVPGMLDYAGAGCEIAWEGGQVAWTIVSEVGKTLPSTANIAIDAAQNAALDQL